MNSYLTFSVCLLIISNIATAQQSLLINEILFNPVKDGFDYVELYNGTDDTINLQTYMVGNRNATNDVANLKVCTQDETLVPPHSLAVLCANIKWLRQQYVIPEEAVVVQCALPSFPDDEGTVLIARKHDTLIVDELNYSENWHFRLIDEDEGIALERITYGNPTNDSENWTSASSSTGFASPGKVNSQRRPGATIGNTLVISPKVFTPDNNGVDDYLFIDISVNSQGFVANGTIYDVSGRRVRYLLKNELLGSSGRFRWDGTDDRSQKVSVGAYVLVTNLFNTEGETYKFRNVVVVGN